MSLRPDFDSRVNSANEYWFVQNLSTPLTRVYLVSVFVLLALCLAHNLVQTGYQTTSSIHPLSLSRICFG